MADGIRTELFAIAVGFSGLQNSLKMKILNIGRAKDAGYRRKRLATERGCVEARLGGCNKRPALVIRMKQPSERACEYRFRIAMEAKPMTQSGIAALLSLFLPGVGQIYNGDFLRGIFWLIVTPGLWIGTGGMLGWICHLIAAYTAHNRGRKYMLGQLP
jgi:TM2 domain-containing membrane protein YozV